MGFCLNPFNGCKVYYGIVSFTMEDLEIDFPKANHTEAALYLYDDAGVQDGRLFEMKGSKLNVSQYMSAGRIALREALAERNERESDE